MSAWICTKDDVADMKFGYVRVAPSFSEGEG